MSNNNKNDINNKMKQVNKTMFNREKWKNDNI